MPQTVAFKTSGVFGDGTLPVIPYTLTGAPTARARWLATSGKTGSGTVDSWTSLDGSLTMTPVAGTAPGDQVVDGKTVVRFNGTSSQLQASLAQSRPHSFAITFYVHAVPTTYSVVVGGQVSPGTDPALHDSGMLAMSASGEWNINAGSNGTWGAASTGWHTAVVSFDATTTSGRIDGVTTTRDVGQVPRKIITLGGHRNANYTQISVAELVVFDGSLTSTQRADIESAMRTHYGI